MFPQWGFPFLAANIETLPYPMQKVLNQGCEIFQKGPLPLGEDLKVACHLVEVREEEARVRIHQRLSTGTLSQPDLVTCDLFGVVVKGKSTKKSARSKVEERPWSPVGGWTASANEGLAFAMLTGDFNPIHWVGPYAKHAGFNNAILHGFASLSRTYETLLQQTPQAIRFLPRISVRFTRPLVLPNRMEVQVQEGSPNKVRLVDENGVVCMVGDYSASDASDESS
jgi:acyl dehydratase